MKEQNPKNDVAKMFKNKESRPQMFIIYDNSCTSQKAGRGTTYLHGRNVPTLLHCHPTAAKTTELVVAAIKANNLPQARAYIDAVDICRSQISMEKTRSIMDGQPEYPHLLPTAIDCDNTLHERLLDLYQNALMAQPSTASSQSGVDSSTAANSTTA